MIADPPTRRSVVIGGLLGAATLTGCSVSELTTRKIEDPQAADRARIAQALALASALRSAIGASPDTDPRLDRARKTFEALHDAQIAQFKRSADVRPPTPPPLGSSKVNLVGLRQREQDLAHALRGLALSADSGHVAALLASAAAGIDQALAR